MRAEPPIPLKHRMASRILGSILFEAMRHLLAQTDARCPASEVVGHHLDRQPGGVGGEAARGEMVESDAVLEVSDGVLDLGVAPMVGLQFPGVAVSIGDESVIAVGGEQRQLGATLCPCPGRAEVTNW